MANDKPNPKRNRTLGDNQSGATAVEYGLMLSLMVLALIGALGATGDRTKEKWDDNANKIVEATNG